MHETVQHHRRCDTHVTSAALRVAQDKPIGNAQAVPLHPCPFGYNGPGKIAVTF